VNFCTRCGRQVTGPARFCPGCGAPLDAAPTRPVPGRPGWLRWPGRWATAIAVVVVAALVSGAITWQLTQPPPRIADVAHGQPATSTPAGSATHAASAPASAAPPAASPDGAVSLGGVTVRTGPGAARQPGAARVATFMAGYFDAINQRDYQGYMAKFDDQARPDYTRQKFLAEFGTTADTAAALTGLSPAGRGLLATVTFTSHQSPDRSFTHTACTAWTQRLYLEASGGTYLIGPLPPGSPRTTAHAC
jgi:hypothetical protein